MSTRPVDLGSLKPGNLVVIDGEPCKVVSIEKSKPGKHGSAKARVTAIGIFDGVKRSIVGPVDSQVEIPIINKRTAQVVAISDVIQLMDLETYEVFETLIPEDESIKEKLEPGVNVEYWEIMGRRMIMRVKPT
ncbi:translation initiation factor IF-5A [Candidatus Geothermarchaeota archaeon]|nr:MAG: translation initiation factor IF-5A [Candidatus Geothermarchaeota archaeon]RLG63088.1 MAG: translation initiation factor IF-5A [Candidatus Geothermarchaeota archaeon]HEW93390.1 translation initiation factor IF-5A [Thermoprotei archaeon]